MLVRWAQCLHEVGKLEEAKSVLDRCQTFIAKYPSTHQSNLSELKIEVEELVKAMKLGNAKACGSISRSALTAVHRARKTGNTPAVS